MRQGKHNEENGGHAQKRAEYGDDHEYKESERQEGVLRTSEREVHDLDRPELPRVRISRQWRRQRKGKGNPQQKGIVIPERTEDAEQTKSAQD